MHFRLIPLAAVAAVAFMASLVVPAASTTGSVPVTAAVTGVCTMDTSAANITGTIPALTPKNQSVNFDPTSIHVHCTSGVSATLTADLGLNPPTALGATCSAPTRAVKGGSGSGTDTMYYGLNFASFATGGGSNIGCDAPNNGFILPSTSVNTDIGGTLSARIITADVPAGSYTDTVTLTLAF
jgi:spore coat protein U-like protein